MKSLYFVLCILLLHGCSNLNKKIGLKDDHPLEEMTERFIYDRTDVRIDLSPDSPE